MLKKFALALALACAPAAALAQAFPGMTVCSPGTGTGVCVGQNSPTLTGTVTLPGAMTVGTTANNQNNFANITVPVVANQGTFGINFAPSITLPSSPTSGTIPLGFGINTTITGNGSNISNEDMLSFIDTTTLSNMTGTLPLTGGMESSVYSSNGTNNPTFTSYRDYEGQNAHYGAATVSFGAGVSIDFTHNDATVGTWVDFSCNSFQSIPGTGSFNTSNEFCVRNEDSNKQIFTQGPVVVTSSGYIQDNGPAYFYGSVNFESAGSVAFNSSPAFNAGFSLASGKQIVAPTGCSTAPAYTFSGDTSTGICHTGTAGAIVFDLSGTSAFGMNQFQFFSETSGGAYMQSNASNTAPHFLPNGTCSRAGVGDSQEGNTTIFASNGSTCSTTVNVIDTTSTSVTLSQATTVSGGGLVSGSPSGGAEGTGTINASGYYAGGTAGVTGTTCTQWTNGLCTHT